MATRTTRRLAAAMAAAALLAIAGFTALGSVFEYPQILKEPTADILALYRAHQGAVMVWFLVLMVSAALLAPAGILLGRLAGGPRGRWIARVGVVAAVVQAVGLSRWVLLVPGISHHATDPSRTAAALIATGVVIPLGLDAASLTNFAGYVLWCLWLLAMAAFLWRTPAAATTPSATVTGANPVPGR